MRSSNGASLIILRVKDSLRAVVDYLALDKVTNRNGHITLSSDDIPALTGNADVYSKINLNSVSSFLKEV